MATEEQIKANRENSKLSTGPRDTSVVKHNALKHGLTAQTVLLKGEDREAFEELLSEVRDKLNPDGAIETELADQIVFAFWKIRRCRNIDKIFIEENSEIKGIKWANLFGAEYMEKFTKYETSAINQVGKLMGMLLTFQAQAQSPSPPQE